MFEPSYVALRRFVRVGGLESDLHPLPPKEFHADTSELVRILKKGHHNVRLDQEAWDRLVTWIDLNAPCHGTWGEMARIPGDHQSERRLALRRLYGGVVEDDEEIPPLPTAPVQAVMPEPMPKPAVQTVSARNWPFSAAEAQKRQAAEGPVDRSVDLGNGLKMELVRIPAGEFVMGDAKGEVDEQPLTAVRIASPFWMARFAVTNEQFGRFDPAHDSRFEHRSLWIFSEEYLGWRLNRPRQPVVRVSWQEAMDFCRWLSNKLGQQVTLPTEAQWEYACRAGSDSPLSYGDLDSDFSRYANMADVNIRRLADEGWRPKAPDLVPRHRASTTGAGDRRCGQLSAQHLGAVRHARQRGTMDAEHVSTLPLSQRRRPGDDFAGRAEGCPRRFLARPAQVLPLGVSLELSILSEGFQRRLPRRDRAALGPGGFWSAVIYYRFGSAAERLFLFSRRLNAPLFTLATIDHGWSA